MANPVKLAIIQKQIEGQMYDLLVKTRADNVVMEDGTTTLAAYLAGLTTGTGYVTQTEMSTAINAAISALVNGAPAALDTLKEIANWIEANEDTYDALLATVGGKVDKVDGKGLSTNDFTNEFVSKIAALESHAADTGVHVTAADKAKLATAARVLVAATIPAGLTEHDLFLQTI